MKEMMRSCAEPSFMPAMMPKVSDSGIIRAKTQKARYAGIVQALDERASTTGSFFWKERAEIAFQDAADPFGVALVEGDVQPLLLEPASIVLIATAPSTRKAAELVDGDLLLELVAVEDGEEQQRDDRHDQHHLQKAVGDQLEHGRSLCPRA